MDIALFAKGLVIGFSIAVPVGPIGVLCIRRTLAEGRTVGFLSGLGAATADAMYGAVVGFGLTLISGFLIRQQVWFGVIGGLFLCYLGLKTVSSSPVEPSSLMPSRGLIKAYASTLFLTITNPATILSFAAIFAGLGLSRTSGTYVSASLLVLGVFLGSALWWLVLSAGVSLVRARVSLQALRWVNRISGIIITGFGLLVLLSLV